MEKQFGNPENRKRIPPVQHTKRYKLSKKQVEFVVSSLERLYGQVLYSAESMHENPPSFDEWLSDILDEVESSTASVHYLERLYGTEQMGEDKGEFKETRLD